tara:strand:+ start:622 stop:846 length:225 start_codon:yes stop_codon:yes gene_type:complete
MSAVDTRMEFCSEVDDWWCQLFALRIGASPPSGRIKFKFISFVEDRCSEVDSWRISDDDLTGLFVEFIERFGDD